MKLTAESITDAQIRELLATIPHEGGINAARREACHVALGEACAQKTRLAAFKLTREDARARCAEILNARAT